MRTAKTIALIGAALSFSTIAGAQQTGGNLEIRPFVGAFVPTGDNREIFGDAFLAGVSGAYRVRENIALVATLGWAASKVKGELPAGFSKDNLDIYSYDLGVQLSRSYGNPNAWTFTPLVGLGAGGRTYNLREDRTDARTDFAAYGALGAEVARGRVGLRLTARDYVTAMEKYAEGESGNMARNDLAFGAGLTIRF